MLLCRFEYCPGQTGNYTVAAIKVVFMQVLFDALSSVVINLCIGAAIPGGLHKHLIEFNCEKCGIGVELTDDFFCEYPGTWTQLYYCFCCMQVRKINNFVC